MLIPSFLIRCPNHNEQLYGVELDVGGTSGFGICPVSKCRFDFSCDNESTEIKNDKNGVPIPVLKFTADADGGVEPH